MQAVSAGFSTATFANKKLSKATVIRSRDDLLIKALELVRFDGLICEFGVYKGYSLRIIADVLKDRPVYGFDSFEGPPEVWRAGFEKGTFKVDAAHMPTFSRNVRIFPGWFESALPNMLNEDKRPAAFLHIDCDLYSSTECVFDLIAGRLVAGTVIVFDEYFNFPGWEQDEHRALAEAARDFGFDYEYVLYNPNGQQVAIVLTKVCDS